MYKNFFGFKEKPFKLIPNPAYLFLSTSHEEALAHLNYAIAEGDGFIKITGEVGTGKTTLCRAFLENLNENIDVAYIFNPKLNSLQLLKAINDEFGISSKPDNTKNLIDILNAFLMEKKAQGKKVVLLIDEAQNLTKPVLEQLRLLSNLETTQTKLLQIILVGQPELNDFLHTPGLRQLGQRISVSSNLSPLTYKETRDYIHHRINIASLKQRIKFPEKAVAAIYKYSEGIPRLINIVCDRILLTAYGLNQHRITGRIARTAIGELSGKGRKPRRRLFSGYRSIFVLSTLSLVLLVIVLNQKGLVSQLTDQTFGKQGKPVVFQPIPEETEAPNSTSDTTLNTTSDTTLDTTQDATFAKQRFMKTNKSVIQPVGKWVDLGEVLNNLNTGISRQTAIKAVIQLWDTSGTIQSALDSLVDNASFFRLAAKQNGLHCQRVLGDLNLVWKLNLPAILELHLFEDLSPAYLTLSKIENGKITLIGENDIHEMFVKPDDILTYWKGIAYIPWKDFSGFSSDIPHNASEDSIVTLKILLKEIGFDYLDLAPAYDQQTELAVKEIQQKHGVPADGIVGPLTKIILYNEKKSLSIPHIR